MSTIVNISTALPPYKHNQGEIGEFMADLYNYSGQKRDRLLTLYRSSGIHSRYSFIPDYSLAESERIFFPRTKDLEPFPRIEYRMEFFNRHAPGLCLEAIRKCLEGTVSSHEITHLITVSCTGISAPGLDIEIARQLDLNENINRTSVNFMGCYAALHALKQADYICKAHPEAVVMIICAELCTIHFQKEDLPDNIIANLLFADGAAAALIVGDDYMNRNSCHGLSLKKFFSQITFSGSNDMVWEPTSSGFLMTLSSYVPELIEKGIKNLFSKTMCRAELDENVINHWAIHPGGKKILATVQRELGIRKEDMEPAMSVLRDHGNMSSPTFLFVLKNLWEQRIDFTRPEITFGVAFGPGLTMESVIIENV